MDETEISGLAQQVCRRLFVEMEASGRRVYNLSIGTPDFQPEPHVIAALTEAAQDPNNWKYALTETPALVEAVENWYRRRYGVELVREEIMSVYGSQEGLTHIACATPAM